MDEKYRRFNQHFYMELYHKDQSFDTSTTKRIVLQRLKDENINEWNDCECAGTLLQIWMYANRIRGVLNGFFQALIEMKLQVFHSFNEYNSGQLEVLS